MNHELDGEPRSFLYTEIETLRHLLKRQETQNVNLEAMLTDHATKLTKKDAEIERLKQYACQCEASVHSTQQSYADLQDEIERLKIEGQKDYDGMFEFQGKFIKADQNWRAAKELLVCAADTLEEEFGKPNLDGLDLSQKSPWNLIIKLRKAAA